MPAVNTIGLFFASAASLGSVITDVARKKALRNNHLLQTTFWVQVGIAVTLSMMLAARLALGHPLTIRTAASESAFIRARHLPPDLLFFLYLLVDTSLIGISAILYFRALQISPISTCVPFLSFTPVFLVLTEYFFLGERVTREQLAGVFFVVLGSLLMFRELFRKNEGWIKILRGLIREEGSRNMMVVSFIFSITNPIDKRLVEMSDPFFQAWAYGVMLVFFLGTSIFIKHGPRARVVRSSLGWIVLAALLEATALLLQFLSHKYIQVVITISIKRAGVILAVLFGGLVFHERKIADRLVAASVMAAGTLMLYLPMGNEEAAAFSLVILACLVAALFLIPMRTALDIA